MSMVCENNKVLTEKVALDMKRAADRYDIDVRTFKKIVEKFSIPFIRIGRKYIFPINSLDEAMKRAAEESR